ncbi:MULTISPECIES: AsmA family protein [Photobacterium]|uniref:Putative assembly protein n=1 Tax=Photobacterium piscicola TaxID=1378299 RepID=A0A1T5I1D9_9GAMM|nr:MULTISPECIES: AsmA family protein [Photobacterium]PST93965.1 AsmA family protein [Photobacterium sp. NCIMB 13483]SKC32887.1 putative assembly protein [Photobacterium piscicola]
MKKILYILLGLILLVVIGIGALVTFVNPNQFKPLLTEQVKKMTGRDLVINGDISWRFFPTLGLSVGDTEFRNPAGFAEPNLIQFKQADLSVSVLPLLSQHLDIGEMRLDGAHVFIQTLNNGATNLDGLTDKTAVAETTTGNTVTHGEKNTHWNVSVAGIKLVNASAEVRNDKTKMVAQLNHINFTLDSFQPQTWTKATFDVQGNVNALTFSAQGSTEINLAADYKNVRLKALSATMNMTDGKTEIKNAQLGLDQFNLGQWSNMTFSVNGKVPNLNFDTHGTAKVKLSTDHNVITVQGLKVTNDLVGKTLPRPTINLVVDADATYDISQKLTLVSQLSINADGTQASGSGSYLATAIPDIRFALSSDNINLDSWLPAKTAVANTNNSTTAAGAAAMNAPVATENNAKTSTAEPDLSALKNINLAGMIAIKQLTVDHANVTNVKVVTSIKQGVATINRFEANLYGGKVTGSAAIDVNSALPSYRLKNTISNVDLLPLLKAVANNNLLAGKANITTDLRGQGLSEANIRHNITGSIKVNVSDGAVYGVNIPDLLRNAKAKFKGQADTGTDTAKKTDFSALTTTLKLHNGTASTDNFKLASPLVAITGQGNTSLVNESIDLMINSEIVASGKGLDEIKGIAVPIHVSGTWQQPKYNLNIKDLFKNNAALESKAKKEINRGLEKLLGDKAKDENIKNVADKLLKGLFN